MVVPLLGKTLEVEDSPGMVCSKTTGWDPTPCANILSVGIMDISKKVKSVEYIRILIKETEMSKIFLTFSAHFLKDVLLLNDI